MKKRQTVIAAVDYKLSTVVILAAFLLVPAACLDGTAQPGTDLGDVTELSEEEMTALSNEQSALHKADGDPSSTVSDPAVGGADILSVEETDVLSGEAIEEEARAPGGYELAVLDCGSTAQPGEAVECGTTFFGDSTIVVHNPNPGKVEVPLEYQGGRHWITIEPYGEYRLVMWFWGSRVRMTNTSPYPLSMSH